MILCLRCGELSQNLEETVTYNFHRSNYCKSCCEQVKEANEEWFAELQLYFEGFLEDMNIAFQWREKHKQIISGEKTVFEPQHSYTVSPTERIEE